MILKERYEECMEELDGGIKDFKVIILITKYKKLLKIKRYFFDFLIFEFILL